ncbi:diguanylate cyclase [Clostridioides difficile]|uniref:Two-component sensor histidine kinase n=21 Tax=Clostridioides difficile TaxID=1496 RepID=A0AB74QC06_CLODI|nr:diguanylate cyclase [Clostridioides difficile]EQG78056.1 diguanylate cyclase domain protein [Clostridioides difficile DA00165]OFU37507.1 diguanylate cyclase [Clostridium sp. HMSC19B04]OFU45225.1 diguanylate cyclase [Clostridium sp. HMSC19A11]AQU10291.1 GGDEF domain-containing protein [Clostridioides difficile]ASN89012.1 GGDEF domain-containing protein [Clostridioides difficile]
MKKNTLLHTNIMVCIIITLGFVATSIIGYQSNTNIFKNDIEHVSTLAAEGIYYQIDKLLSEPINVSLTMANDSLLKNFLDGEKEHLNDEEFIYKLQDYLNVYRNKYSYDSVFLVSTKTNNYYHFNGLDRNLSANNSENQWYYTFLKNDDEYSLNVDNDEASNNSITVFVNCKIKDDNGATMGIIGVGLKVNSLQMLLKGYNDKFDVVARLIDDKGFVQLAVDKTGHENINFFENSSSDLSNSKQLILNNKKEQKSFWYSSEKSKSYIVCQYIPSLKWHLVLENDFTLMIKQLHLQFFKGIAVIVLIIIFVLFTITHVLKKYKNQIIKLSVSQKLEYQKLLSKSTEGLYENIFEIDITNNKAGCEDENRYFHEFGLGLNTPYDEALHTIAKNQIKEEYAQGYLDTFLPENVIKRYNSGINNISYDFLIKKDEESYHWIRINARIFFWTSDESVRMISYRKNIDEEKNRELLLLERSQRDSLTGLYNKATTEEFIRSFLKNESNQDLEHVFLIFDIDNFKNVNDKYGHVFGDFVISEFALELKSQFREDDIVGRIGGDEFVVLIKDFNNNNYVLIDKLERFCSKINQKKFVEQAEFSIACSIGVAMYPEHGYVYSELYEKADQALYYAKSHGKNSYHIFSEDSIDSISFHIDSRDIKVLLEMATDGVVKFACMENLKLLYFNQKMLEFTGYSAQTVTSIGFDIFSPVLQDDLQMVLDTLREAISKRETFEIVFRFCHTDGHIFPVRMQGKFVSELYQNRYPVFYAIYTDISSINTLLENK